MIAAATTRPRSKRSATTAPEPLRVLHVLPALHGGGMEHATLRLIRAWTRPDCESDIPGNIEHNLCILRDASPELLEQARVCTTTWIRPATGNNHQARDGWAWWRLRRVIRNFRPDIVHARSTGTWLDACLATLAIRQTRLLLSFHGRTDTGPIGRRQLRINRWAAARADAVLTVSREAAHMIHDQWGVPRDQLVTIPNGLDTQEYRPAENLDEIHETRVGLGLNNTHHVVICIANLLPIKGLDVLLKAWRQVNMTDPDARLLIAGEGQLHDELANLTGQLRCRSTVQFLGRRADVPELLRCADLFVSPSRYEACSNAILEAMATGLPVIATETGGTPELIRPNRTGWLVPTETPDRLAQTILIALMERAARKRVGQAARNEAVKRFSLERWVRQYAACYRSLLAEAASPPARIMEDLLCAE